MHLDWQPLVSALMGGTGVLWIARHYLEKSLQKLDSIPSDLSNIEVKLTKVTTQLEDLPDMKKMIHAHDRDIGVLKAVQKIKSLDSLNGH